MISGLSKWSNEVKRPDKSGKEMLRIISEPIMCDCGGSTPIGGDGSGRASFFFDDFEWICLSCGRVMEPDQRDYEENILQV